MKLKLEAIDEKDAQAVRDVAHFVNSNYPYAVPVEEATIASGKLKLFWAKDAATGALVGATGYFTRTPFLAETAKTVLAPAYRGKGVGAILSQVIEDEVRRAGFKKIMSSILITNLPMIIIKLKQGYIFEGTHYDHDKPGLHEYTLGKVLR
ncbi:MAG: GNAT family N-acetyltransferase [Bdellovibrionota bacterium]